MSAYKGMIAVATVAVAVVALVVAGGRPASAHEGEEDEPAGVVVRQAIALIVNRPNDHEAIEDRIADAPEAEDTEGVDLARVEQAGQAFGDGDLHRARALLEESIGAQPHIATGAAEPLPIRETSPLARGDEPGEELIAESLDLPGRDGGDWALLAASVAVGALGVWLGWRYRPRHVEGVSRG
jgi:hypothetical protein